MSATQGRLAIAIGECMVELARGPDGRFGQSFGGDTFNTAVYLARAGVPTAYATALGDDPYSCGIVATARAEGVATDLIDRRPGRMPGLYLIETSTAGERTFHYWRDRSPARELLDGDGEHVQRLMRTLSDAGLVYVSGITLSLYSSQALDRLDQALGQARAAGAMVAMDGNFRPRGWSGDIARARAVIERFWRRASIALPTFDDEAALWGDHDPGQTIERLQRLGIGEIAVKMGGDGVMLAAGLAAPRVVPVPALCQPVDTTAAGDSFNAAYLAARVSAHSPEASALAGHRLAAVVIAHRGAIVPHAATARVLAELVAANR